MKSALETAVLLVALGPAAVADVPAQSAFPTKPIRLIVPSVAGGGTDISARLIAPRLGEYLGQQVVVENRAGAAMMIGGEIVARAAPDGYTLLMGMSTMLTAIPHVRDGRLRALGVTGVKRSPILPELPTIAEAALPFADTRQCNGTVFLLLRPHRAKS